MSDPVQVSTVDAAPTPKVDVLGSLSDTQRDHWLKTGDLPESKVEPQAPPLKDEVAPVADSAEHAPLEAPAVEPSTEPAKVAKPRDDIKARLGQLAEQRRIEKERADRLEAEVADLRAKVAPPAPVAPAVEPAEPKLDDFLSDPDPYAAYARAVGKWEAKQQIAQFQAEQAQRVQRDRDIARVDAVMAEGPKKYPDWDLTPLQGHMDGPSAAYVAALIFESPLSVELLYHFSKTPAEARRLAAMEPLAAARAFGSLESQLSTPPPSRIATPTKTVSTAPEPPQTLGSRHTPNAGDEVEAAILAGDTGRYIEAENRRELAKMKAGLR